jgi:hypothetical protein
MLPTRSVSTVAVALLAAGSFGCQLFDRGEGAARHAGVAADAAFPPEGVDHLRMAVSVDVEIAGIGKDTVELEGSVAVHRSGPLGEGGKTMKGALIGASLRGTSDVFGEVQAVQSPTQISPCEYTQVAPGEYDGRFDIHGWFWLPKHGRMFYTDTPVRVAGKAAAIPPVGQVAKHTEETVPLRDFSAASAGKDVGFVSNARGEIRALVPIADYLK